MEGALVRYGSLSSQLAFISAGSKGAHGKELQQCLVLVGGLTDGFMFCRCVRWGL
jgi:hypothetical protein